MVARLETACRLLHGIGGNNTRVNEIGVEIQILSEDLRRVGNLLESSYPGNFSENCSLGILIFKKFQNVINFFRCA